MTREGPANPLGRDGSPQTFGQPSVRNVLGEPFAEDYRAGPGRDDLADLYDLTLQQVNGAIRFEMIAGS